MFTQSSSSNTASSSSPSSSPRSLSPTPFQDDPSEVSPTPSPFYTPSSSPAPPPETTQHTSLQSSSRPLESPPLDAGPFFPQSVDVGIASPRPMHGQFSPFHGENILHTQAGTSPVRARTNPFGSPSIPAASPNTTGISSPFGRHTASGPLPSPPLFSDPQPLNSAFGSEAMRSAASWRSATQNESIYVVHPSAGTQGPIPASSPSQSVKLFASSPLQRSVSPLPEAINKDKNPDQEPISKSPASPSTNPSHSTTAFGLNLWRDPDALHPEPLAGPSNSLTPSNPLADNPFREDTATSSATAVPPSADDPTQLDLSEIDSEGLSVLEKIYLFSRSRLGFHRVFIARALAGFLRSSSHDEGTSTQTGHDQPVPDHISPEEAVEYVLPLLNALAMDDDEAVKEALAGELVPIIWWFITRCKLVEDDSLLAANPDAEQVLQGTGMDHSHQSYHDEDTPLYLGLSHSETQAQQFSVSGPSTPIAQPVPRRPPEVPDILRSVTSPPQTPRPSTPRPPTPIPERVPPARPPAPVPPEISVQSFTPMLGTLLLSTNASVGGPARHAVVELLKRVRRADEAERPSHRDASPGKSARSNSSGTSSDKSQRSQHNDEDEDEEDRHSPVGLLGGHERRMFEKEMVQQVVIGMGRLDMLDDQDAVGGDPLAQPEVSTPGSPPSVYSTPLPSPFASTPRASASHDSYFPALPPTTSALATYSASPLSTSPVVYGSHDARTALSLPLEFPSSAARPPPTQLTSSPALPASFTLSPAPSSSTPSLTSTSTSSSPEEASPDAFPSLVSDKQAVENRVDVVDPATQPWIQPRSPGDLPPISDEERREWERQYVPSNFALHSIFGVPSDSSSGSHTGSGQFSGVSDSGEGTGSSAQEDIDLSEEAAVGRLSSMSLMAAVTASGSLAEDTKAAFVTEVERVGRDPIYWVRREASFTVGALAKVVPVEIVRTQLLPLFKLLCHDPFWQVRHSALFALPNILSRLEPAEKCQLALDVVLPLSKDENQTVRCGVLEALAEVIYTFHEDGRGPPPELLRLFLGIREGETERRPSEPPAEQVSDRPLRWSDFVASVIGTTPDAQDADIYEDPSRPLVCAFNFPAVALTLGPDRWHELRSLYLELSLNPSLKVRRTLAASLGELAKIIGPEQARQDLLGEWWGSVRADESEIRLKAVECLDVFVCNLPEDQRAEIIRGILSELWKEKFRNWREREVVMKHLPSFVSMAQVEDDLLLQLFIMGLEDSVSAVREAAIASIPTFLTEWASRPQYLEQLFQAIRPLASASQFRKRMIYIACQQEIIVSGNYQLVVENEEYWEALQSLATDTIVDVRIRVARLLGLISDNVLEPSDKIKSHLKALAEILSGDSSYEVQAFSKPILNGTHPIFLPRKDTGRVIKSTSNFSRPPPAAG